MKQHVVYQFLLIYENLAAKQSTRELNISAGGRTCKLVIYQITFLKSLRYLQSLSVHAGLLSLYILLPYSTHRDNKSVGHPRQWIKFKINNDLHIYIRLSANYKQGFVTHGESVKTCLYNQ